MKTFVAGISIAFSLLWLVESTPFFACPGKPAPNSVDIENCDSLPCSVYEMSYVPVKIDFTTAQDVGTSMQARAKVMAMGITVNWPVEQRNECDSIDVGCPLTKDQDAVYDSSIHVTRSPVTFAVKIEFTLVDEKNSTVLCFTSKLKVLDRPKEEEKEEEETNNEGEEEKGEEDKNKEENNNAEEDKNAEENDNAEEKDNAEENDNAEEKDNAEENDNAGEKENSGEN